MSEYVIMPSNDYQNVCDTIREASGKTDLIKSGDLSSEIAELTKKIGKASFKSSVMPSETVWTSVTYGDGKFVAVSQYSTTAAYSTDGINWTDCTMPSESRWYNVAYGNGKFVAVSYLINGSTAAAYSTDGINWTAFSLPYGYSESVTYGNGKFVAMVNGNIALYSTDGINWSNSKMPRSEDWTSVTYGDGKFVAVSQYSITAAYSTDGINWTVSTMPNKEHW